jgi:diguanylate cyclase (GGDEF)-like protein
MTAHKENDSRGNNSGFFGKNHLFLAAGSVCALIITFFVSNAEFTFKSKTAIFLTIVILYLLFCFYIYWLEKRQAKTNVSYSASQSSESIFSLEEEGKLLALHEANEFFGATLKSSDMFRLVATRIAEMIPFEVCALAIADENKSKLKFNYAAGANSQDFINLEVISNKGLAGLTFQSAKPQIENELLADKNVISAKVLNNLKSGIAVPLLQNAECFGALILYGAAENQFDARLLQLLEAVGARVAPLFLSSRAFDNSLNNALVDALTKLPNERGFYLVLENQIAEAQRFKEDRSLAILTIDIKNFGELNQKYGHATGDKILEYAANTIKNQLRQMDFLARSMSDEFLAVLPTASDDIAREIIERIKKTFISKPFEISAQEHIHLQLNFGAASFGRDGETAEHLLRNAVLRKQQSKSVETSKILWFPKEYVN